MEHTENNILIAEFLGIDRVDVDTYLSTEGDLKYNSSWDWLMSVVEKIKNIGTHSETSEREYILLDNINDALIVVRIDLVYSAVIDFIKWHNKNLDKL